MASSKAEILESLLPQQREPVINYKGKSFVISGPGSGKTRVMVSRAAYMIFDAVDPASILLFTFTRKAADEMRKRLASYVGGEIAKKVTICTYHSFCVKLLRQYGYVYGYTPEFSIYDETESLNVLKRCLNNPRVNVSGERLQPKKAAQYLEELKTACIQPKDAYDWLIHKYGRHRQGNVNGMSQAYTLYQQALKNDNAMDFNDLMILGHALIYDYPQVLSDVQDRFKYICSDETNDATPTDIDFILRLGSRDQNICCVLDNDQAIYGFRGGDIDNVLRVLKNNNFTQYNLDRNFRSTKSIVNAAVSLIKKNGEPVQKNLFSENEDGDKPLVTTVPAPNSEAAAVASTIRFLHDEKGVAYNDIAVLSRLQKQSRLIEGSLIARKIPYRVISGLSFYERAEIKDIVSYLRIAWNPYDTEAFLRSVNLPARGIGKSTIDMFIKVRGDNIEESGNMTIFESIKMNLDVVLRGKKLKAAVQEYVNLVNTIKKYIDENVPPHEIVRFIINAIDYDLYIESRLSKADPEGEMQRKGNLEELIDIARDFDTFAEFIDSVNSASGYVTDMNSFGTDTDDRVNIVTMHGSKGLEWENVFIIGAIQGVTPCSFNMSTNKEIQEERRLFYVAMTRAKKRLFIFKYTGSFKNGVKSSYMPSQFLKEIDPSYLDSTI